MLDPSPARDHSPPRSDLDLWSETALADPDGHDAELRRLRPVVWLDRNESWARKEIIEYRPMINNALQGPARMLMIDR